MDPPQPSALWTWGSLGVGIAALGWLLWRLRRDPDAVPRGTPAPEPWGLAWAAGTTAAYLAVLTAGIVALLAAGLVRISPDAPLPLGALLSIDAFAKVVGLVGAIAAHRVVTRRAEPGRPAPAAPSVRVGALAGLAFLPFMLGISLAQQELYEAAKWKFEGQRVVQDALRGDDATLVALAYFAVVVAPFYEEWVFRWWLHGGLRRFMGRAPALLLSSAAFSLYHLEPDAFPVTFALGLAAGALRERTGGLHAPIALHACYNAVQVLGILSARGG